MPWSAVKGCHDAPFCEPSEPTGVKVLCVGAGSDVVTTAHATLLCVGARGTKAELQVVRLNGFATSRGTGHHQCLVSSMEDVCDTMSDHLNLDDSVVRTYYRIVDKWLYNTLWIYLLGNFFAH